MRKIITILVFVSATCVMGWAQNEVRLIDISPTRVVVQMRLGVGTVLPSTGVDICNPNGETDDGMFADMAVAVVWTDLSITNLTVVDEDADSDVCTPTSNTVACECFDFPPFCLDLTPGPGYGVQVLAGSDVSGAEGDIEYRTYGNILNTCTIEGFWNAPLDWVGATWYTIVTLDVTTSSPPGAEPLALTDMLSVQQNELGNIQAPSVSTTTDGLGSNVYPLTVNNDPLPLNLLAFDAKREGDKSAALVWTTANEVNTKLFVIERSNNRESWNDIGGVEAAVTSSGIKQYNFLDKNVYDGRSNREVYYYRLKMVDQDDSFRYSNIDVVSFSSFLTTQDGFKLYMYPNPATQGVNVEIAQPADSEPITHLELYDVSGKMVFNRDIAPGSEIEYIDFAALNMSSGTYVLRAVDAANVAQAHEKLVVLR